MSSTKKKPLVFHLDPEVIELLENLSLEKDKPASAEVPLPEKEEREESNINKSKHVKTTQNINDTHKNVFESNAPSRDKPPKTNSDKILNTDFETLNTKRINGFKFKDKECLPRNEISSNEEQENGVKFQSHKKTLSDLNIACEQLNSKFASIELADDSYLNEIDHETSSYTKLQDGEELFTKVKKVLVKGKEVLATKNKEKIEKEKASKSLDLLGKDFIFGKPKGDSKLIERGKDDKNRNNSRVKEYDILHRAMRRYPDVYDQHLHRPSSNQAVNNDLLSSPEYLSSTQLQSYNSSLTQRDFIPFEEDDYPWNGLQFVESSECIPKFSDLVSDLSHLINSHESLTENLNGVATTPVSDNQNYPVNYVGDNNFQPYLPFQRERFNPDSSSYGLEPSVNLLDDSALLDESCSIDVRKDIFRSSCSKDYSYSPSYQSESSCAADDLYYDTEATVPCGTGKCVETVSEKTERLGKYITRVNHKPRDDEPSLPVLTANDTEEFFKTLSEDIPTSYNIPVEENIITRDNHSNVPNYYKESENHSNLSHANNIQNSRKCDADRVQKSNEFMSLLQMPLCYGNTGSSVDHTNRRVSKSCLSTSFLLPPEPVKDTDTIGKPKEQECFKKSPNIPRIYSSPSNAVNQFGEFATSMSNVQMSSNNSNEENHKLDLNNRLSPRNYANSHVKSHLRSGFDKLIPSSKAEIRQIQCVLKTSAKHSLFYSPDFSKEKCRSEYERLYKEIQEQQLGTEDKKIIHRLKKRRSTNYEGTNLHDALLKGNIERFYCILEIHKQVHKSVFDVNTRDSRGKTVLDYARMWNLHSVIEYLEENTGVKSVPLDR